MNIGVCIIAATNRIVERNTEKLHRHGVRVRPVFVGTLHVQQQYKVLNVNRLISTLLRVYLILCLDYYWIKWKLGGAEEESMHFFVQ